MTLKASMTENYRGPSAYHTIERSMLRLDADSLTTFRFQIHQSTISILHDVSGDFTEAAQEITQLRFAETH